MLKKIIRLFNSVVFNNLKFLIIKLFHYKRFKFSLKNVISPTNIIDIQNKGSIFFGRWLNIPSKSLLGVRDNGVLDIKDGVFINSNCQIIAHKKIEINENVCIGPNTIIVDHDHFFGKSRVDKKKFKTKEIIIGSGTWIGANCVILKGTKIGKNCVISAGSIVNCEVPDNTIFIQKRENQLKKI